MKAIYWNARGLANTPTKLVLKRMLSEYSPDFCFLSEPWLNMQKFPIRWFNRLNFKLFATNTRHNNDPNLWCLCSKNLDPNVVLVDDQHISFTMKENNVDFGFSVVYASTSYIKRRSLWQSLSHVHNNYNMPWSYIGDFNTICGTHEYRGNFLPAKLPMEEFLNWSDSHNLIHLPNRGSDYTWANGRSGAQYTEKRLDRVISNQDMLNTCSSISCSTLTRVRSDHFPLLLEVKFQDIRYISNFKFLKMWSHHQDCSNFINNVWNKQVFGSPMQILSQKLKILKGELKTWNKNVFGNIHINVKNSVEKLDAIQEDINISGYKNKMQKLN